MGKRTRNHRGRRTAILEHSAQPEWALELWQVWKEEVRRELNVIARALKWLLARIEERIRQLDEDLEDASEGEGKGERQR